MPVAETRMSPIHGILELYKLQRIQTLGPAISLSRLPLSMSHGAQDAPDVSQIVAKLATAIAGLQICRFSNAAAAAIYIWGIFTSLEDEVCICFPRVVCNVVERANGAGR